MKIKYITEDDLIAIKRNLSQIQKRVVINGACSIGELFEKENMIKESNLEIGDLELEMSFPAKDSSLTDYENIQRVYNHMRSLSDSIAADERLWVAYTLSEQLDYMRYRWPSQSVSDLNNRYLFGYSPQRSLFRNGMSRLWWIGRVTYDSKRSNPYELTRFICKDQDYIESVCGRNAFNNPAVCKTVITALYDAEINGIEVNREIVREIGKYINVLAGVYLLETVDKQVLYDKVVEKLNNMQVEK